MRRLRRKFGFHCDVSLLPSPNMGIILGTPYILEGDPIVQVIENKMVGDTGFEPVTTTVCKKMAD